MTVVLLAILAGVAITAGAGAYLWLRPALRDTRAVTASYERLERERREREQEERERLEPSAVVRDLFREVVVVTLKSGETFRGVLVAADPHALLLREAAQLAERDAVGIDGELIVPRVDVAYIQRP